jgi:hypothetical protein
VLGLEVNDDYLATEATDLAGVAHHRAVVADDNRADPGEVLDRLLLLVAQALERPFAAGRGRRPRSLCRARWTAAVASWWHPTCTG